MDDFPHLPRPPTSQLVPLKMPVGDPIINRWYQDPYDRLDPTRSTHAVDRRQNLEDALTRQGFSRSNRLRLVTWLMKCNGHYKDFDHKSWKYNRRRAREERAKSKRDEVIAEREARKPVTASQQTGSQEQVARNDQQEEEVGDEDDSDDDDTDDDDDAGNEEVDEILEKPSSDTTAGQWHTATDDERIRHLKDRLRTWDIINPTLSPTTSNPPLDYFRLVPRRIIGVPATQAILEIRAQEYEKARNRGEELPLGLSLRPQYKRATETAPLKPRKEKIIVPTAPSLPFDAIDMDRRIWKLQAHADSEQQFNRGYRETWKEIQLKRAVEIGGTGETGETSL